MGMVLSRQIHRGCQYSGYLAREMEYKTEICELVSEFMPDVTLLDGKSGGGKAKKWYDWDWRGKVGWMGI